MANIKQLISRVEFIKTAIEEKGGCFEVNLTKKPNKQQIFEVLNKMDIYYKGLKQNK